MTRIRSAVFVSGRGSNLKSLIEAQNGSNYEIVLVISDHEAPPAFQYATTAGITTASLLYLNDRRGFAEAAQRTLTTFDVELIALAGFMRILDAQFVEHWRDRIINIHPSLLPAYPGLHPHRRVLEDGAGVSGCTVHYVIPEVDAGPIIGNCSTSVFADDTEETLTARILEMEHTVYPIYMDQVAKKLLEEHR